MTSSSKIKQALVEAAELVAKAQSSDWEWQNEAGECCDGCCTNGYDNDGSTGLEIFQNGLELGEKAGQTKQKIFRVSGGRSDYFFLGENEDEIVQRIKAGANR